MTQKKPARAAEFEGRLLTPRIGADWPGQDGVFIGIVKGEGKQPDYCLIAPVGLTFNALRGANTARLPQFKNKHGGLAHSKLDGSDWSPAQWLQAVVGELGEFANIRKKFERGDLTFAEYEIAAAKELADVQTYLDILAKRALDKPDGTPHPDGVDLGQATMDKFNEVSERVGSTIRLTAADWYYTEWPRT